MRDRPLEREVVDDWLRRVCSDSNAENILSGDDTDDMLKLPIGQ